MNRKRPTTIAEYIRAAPPLGRPHLRRIYRILRGVAPKAQQVIKWGVPFFVDPRFLFSFAAFTAHCVFVVTPAAMEAFRRELDTHATTKNFLKIPYDRPVPESLIRKIAKYRLMHRGDDDKFWAGY